MKKVSRGIAVALAVLLSTYAHTREQHVRTAYSFVDAAKTSRGAMNPFGEIK